MCNCMVLDVTAIFFWITAFLKKLPFLAKGLVTGHTTVIIGVVYRCPNITKQNNEKIHNAINEVSKGDCIIMGDFNHGNIKWDTLQSTGVELRRQHVFVPGTGQFPNSTCIRTNQSSEGIRYSAVLTERIRRQRRNKRTNQLHFNIKIKSDKTKVKQCRRDF